MLHRALKKLAASRPPDRIIEANDGDYLRRWYVIPRNPLFNIYLHQFMQSDDARALHDHPWWNVSYILEGEYTEHTQDRPPRIAKQGTWKMRGPDAPHRIELHAGPCWTLFITGPYVRDWGWHCPKGWVHFKAYSERGGCE